MTNNADEIQRLKWKIRGMELAKKTFTGLGKARIDRQIAGLHKVYEELTGKEWQNEER